MSCLSNATNRRLVLICARLLIQGVMGSTISQTGMDEMRSLYTPDRASIMSSDRAERALTVPELNGALAELRQTGQQRPLC
jgi:hypothetical protein